MIDYGSKHKISTRLAKLSDSWYGLAASGLILRKNERLLKAFRNKHVGDRCFIIGNGPSLNKLDLTKLQQEFTFGVNAIYTNYERMQFHPTYYVVEDTFVAEDRSEEINNYKESVKFFGNYLKYCLKQDDHSLLLNVIFNYSEYEDFPHFSENALRRVWVGGSVTYICLQLAFFMGFKEVYMIGFDHSYEIPKDAIVAGNDITSVDDDPNHFAPEYFGKGKRWHLPRVERMEQGFAKARKHFERNKRSVFNATAGGHLDVFERRQFEKLF